MMNIKNVSLFFFIVAAFVKCRLDENSMLGKKMAYTTYYSQRISGGTLEMIENYILIKKDNGTTEKYDTCNLGDKQKYISKYGCIINLKDLQKKMEIQVDSNNLRLRYKIECLKKNLDSINREVN